MGNGFERFDALADRVTQLAGVQADCWPTATAVALLAADWLKDNPGLKASQAQPVYLRDKVADKPSG